MKNFLLTVLGLCGMASLSYSQAQNYKPIKVDLGIGYAIPTSGGGGTKGGVAFAVEPHYRLSDALAVGLRFEGAALARVSDLNNEDADAKVSILSSYSATGDYYFTDKGFRPFAGAGLGFFRSASITLDEETVQAGGPAKLPGATNFGFFPRVGFEAGHFRVSGEYNIIKDGGYVAFKIGAFFGGGRRK